MTYVRKQRIDIEPPTESLNDGTNVVAHSPTTGIDLGDAKVERSSNVFRPSSLGVTVAAGGIGDPSAWPKAKVLPGLAEAVKAQISRARQTRRNFNSEFMRGRTVYADKDLGGYVFRKSELGFLSGSRTGSNPVEIGDFVLSEVNIRGAEGRVIRPGLFSGADVVETGAAALVIAVKPRKSVEGVIRSARRFLNLSSHIGNKPVFVVTNSSKVFLFDAGTAYIFSV